MPRIHVVAALGLCLSSLAGFTMDASAQVRVLRGTVVPMEGAPFDGYVVVRDSVIAEVGRGAVPDSLAGAETVAGVVYPGLVDLHNHPLYNVLPLWRAPRRFNDRYEWRSDDRYRREVSGVQRTLRDRGLTREIATWAKVRALAGGTVALQGWGNTGGSSPFDDDLARVVEGRNFGRPFPGQTEIDLRSPRLGEPGFADSLRAIQPWILHLAEGAPGDVSSILQADTLIDALLVSPRLRVIHGSAVPVAELGTFAAGGVQIVWSPISNGLLYGATTPVDSAARLGVTVSLGSDWGPSGSKNLLWELKAADRWNQAHGRPFSDSVLVAMVTVRPARALGWPTGTVTAGSVADLVVLDSVRADPYRNLIEAAEPNVRLVLVNGRPVYGDTEALRRAGVAASEVVGTVGGREKSLALPPSGAGRPTLADTRARLETAFRDPAIASLSHLEALFTPGDETFFRTIRETPHAPAWLKAIAQP